MSILTIVVAVDLEPDPEDSVDTDLFAVDAWNLCDIPVISIVKGARSERCKRLWHYRDVREGKEGEREAVRDVSSTCLLRKLHGAAAPPSSHLKGSLVRFAIVAILTSIGDMRNDDFKNEDIAKRRH